MVKQQVYSPVSFLHPCSQKWSQLRENPCLEMHRHIIAASYTEPFLLPLTPKSNRIIWLTVTRSPLGITLPSAFHGICNWSWFSSSSRWLVAFSGSSGLYRAVRILPNNTGFCCCRRNLRCIEIETGNDTWGGFKIERMGCSESHQTDQHWVCLTLFACF